MADRAPSTVREALDVEIEPMLLLDKSGSMRFPTAPDDPTPRRDTIREAFSIVVQALAAEDSQAEHEEEGGGLMTIAFSDQAQLVDDINPNNINEKWNEIEWGGGTRIMPGWNLMVDTYMEEFGDRPPNERPILLALIVTDGEAEDAEKFGQTIAQAAGGVYVAVALLGYGADHDRTERSYRTIAESNPHVKVVSFSGQTNPQEIADALLRMIA